jgi:hypothetical protein
VVRVATSDVVNTITSKNMAFTKRIHELEALPSNITNLVPRTIAVFQHGESTVYVEERKPGILAWKAARNPSVEKSIYRQSFVFIHAFNLATCEQQLVDPSFFDELLGGGLTTLSSAFADVANIDLVIQRIRELLWTHFTDRRIFIVWGHGDYGYGNILCDDVTGRIQGVIDWDTHVAKELPAIDFCNLLLMKHSEELGGNYLVPAALRSLCEKVARTGILDPNLPGYYHRDFHLGPKDLVVCLCVAAIRFIRRSAGYPQEHQLHKPENVETIKLIAHILTGVTSSPPVQNRAH